MSLESYILELQKKESPGMVGRLVLGGLSLLETIYGKGVLRKYKKVSENVVTINIPVISVGNITAGGTGKTPFIIEIAEEIKKKGYHPAVLSRGYKSALEDKGGIVSDGKNILVTPEMAGDEPYMMALQLPGIPVLVGKDRIASAEKAAEFRTDILLLDDGFQYWEMKHDLEIVLIDCTNPFGYDHMIPRGLLREPLEGLKRADIFILTKSNQVSDEIRKEIRERLYLYNPGSPILESEHEPSRLILFNNWKKQNIQNEMDKRKGAKAFLLSGIGNPDAFANTVKDAGLYPAGDMFLEDHHSYVGEDIKKAIQKANDIKADMIVVTEKDAVKMLSLQEAVTSEIPVYVLCITINYSEEDREKLQNLWRKLL